jgi:hypothetical protein
MQQMVKCPGCGRDSAGPQFCTTCGTRLPIAQQQQVVELQPAPVAKPTPKVAVPTAKYGALKAVATVYRIIGWVLMVGGTLFSIALAVIAAQGAGAFSEFIPWSTGPGMVGIAIVGVVVSILFGLFLLAFADLCYVLIDIEINTRSED